MATEVGIRGSDLSCDLPRGTTRISHRFQIFRRVTKLESDTCAVESEFGFGRALIFAGSEGEDVAVECVVVSQIGLGAEVADFHEGSGDKFLGVVVEKQPCSALEVGTFGELEFFDEGGFGRARGLGERTRPRGSGTKKMRPKAGETRARVQKLSAIGIIPSNAASRLRIGS